MPHHGEERPRFMIGGTDIANLAAGVTVYYHVYGGNDWVTMADVEIRVPFNCTIDELRVNVDVAPGAGESWTFTLMDEGGASVLTCQIAGAVATEADDLVNQVSLDEDDRICMRVVSTGGVVTASPSWSMKCVPIGE